MKITAATEDRKKRQNASQKRYLRRHSWTRVADRIDTTNATHKSKYDAETTREATDELFQIN